jgi:phosphatidylglycerophosphate synthase
MKRLIPWTMVIARGVMGPLIVVATWRGVAGWVLGVIVIAMLLDDIADGMLARRWGCETPRLRLWDSCCDTVFYLGTAAAVWLRAPETLRANWGPIAVLFGLEGLRYGLDFVKFGKAASYHSYLAKLWGLVLAGAIVCVLVRGGPAWVIMLAAILGIVVNLEGLAMSVLLPYWQNDVSTLAKAIRIRASAKSEAVGER